MKKMLLYNSNTNLGKLALKAAEIQKWDVKILEKIDYSNNPEILFSEIKKKISISLDKDICNTNLTWITPEITTTSDREIEYFNYVFIPIILSLAFSDICNTKIHNSITLIGRTFGTDFIEGFSEMFDTKSEVYNSLFSSLSTLNLSTIVPLTKYLAFKLGSKNITVNSAAFGPIKDIDSEVLIKSHNNKMLNLTSFTKSSSLLQDLQSR